MDIEDLFDFGQVNLGIITRALRPTIKNAVYRQGISISNTGGQIPLTSHRQNKTGLLFSQNFSRKGTAGCNGNGHSATFRQVGQISDAAFSTAQALVDIPGNLDGAFMKLQTVRQKNNRLTGRNPQFATPNQLIIDGNEGTLQRITISTEQTADGNNTRQQIPDSQTAQANRKKQIAAAEQSQTKLTHSQ